jgi:hypothetical protein
MQNYKLQSADYLVNVEGCDTVFVLNNQLKSLSGCDSRGVRLIDVQDGVVAENEILRTGDCGMPLGIHLGGGNSRRMSLRDNNISRSFNYGPDSEDTFIGIYTDGGGDSIYIKSNELNGLTINGLKRGKGMFLGGSYFTLEADSNVISNFQNSGIEVNSAFGTTWKVRKNTISTVREAGVIVSGSGSSIVGNKISRVKAGVGINVLGSENLVANNFAHVEGAGLA